MRNRNRKWKPMKGEVRLGDGTKGLVIVLFSFKCKTLNLLRETFKIQTHPVKKNAADLPSHSSPQYWAPASWKLSTLAVGFTLFHLQHSPLPENIKHTQTPPGMAYRTTHIHTHKNISGRKAWTIYRHHEKIAQISELSHFPFETTVCTGCWWTNWATVIYMNNAVW